MVAIAATGTVLNAVSARNGSSQNMVAAIVNIVTRLVVAPVRPFCRKRARESTSPFTVLYHWCWQTGVS